MTEANILTITFVDAFPVFNFELTNFSIERINDVG